ncbi:hypothetical protein BJ546DRAFT_1010080 [Cryomyces antarcticus]
MILRPRLPPYTLFLSFCTVALPQLHISQDFPPTNKSSLISMSIQSLIASRLHSTLADGRSVALETLSGPTFRVQIARVARAHVAAWPGGTGAEEWVRDGHGNGSCDGGWSGGDGEEGGEDDGEGEGGGGRDVHGWWGGGLGKGVDELKR